MKVEKSIADRFLNCMKTEPGFKEIQVHTHMVHSFLVQTDVEPDAGVKWTEENYTAEIIGKRGHLYEVLIDDQICYVSPRWFSIQKNFPKKSVYEKIWVPSKLSFLYNIDIHGELPPLENKNQYDTFVVKLNMTMEEVPVEPYELLRWESEPTTEKVFGYETQRINKFTVIDKIGNNWLYIDHDFPLSNRLTSSENLKKLPGYPKIEVPVLEYVL